ncbi:hypothetical protein T484DRAFT_1861011, partial [Baffinella frigidus]
MQTIDQPHRRRRPSSAGERRVTSGLPPADEASTRTSTRTSGFMPLLKPFLWAGTMLPGIAWRKTKPRKAGAEETSYKHDMVQSVLDAPAFQTISMHRSSSEKLMVRRVFTPPPLAVGMLEPKKNSQAEGPRAPIVPMSRTSTFDALSLSKPDALTLAHSFPPAASKDVLSSTHRAHFDPADSADRDL